MQAVVVDLLGQEIKELVELAVVANDTGIETLLQIVTEKVDNKFTDALDDVEVLCCRALNIHTLVNLDDWFCHFDELIAKFISF